MDMFGLFNIVKNACLCIVCMYCILLYCMKCFRLSEPIRIRIKVWKGKSELLSEELYTCAALPAYSMSY